VNRADCRFVVLVTVILALSLRRADAQIGTATLSGTVLDGSGAVVPDVRVLLVNEATQLRLRTTSGSTGFFTFALLPRGRYVLTTNRAGFSPIEVRDLQLSVDDHLHVTLRLTVAPVGEVVQVKGDALRMHVSSGIGTVIDRRFVEGLPLNGRSLQGLLALTLGVIRTEPGQVSAGELSVNGQRPNANYFTVDGVGANVAANNSSIADWPAQEAAGVTPALNAMNGTQSLVAVDALEELSLQTSSYSAQSGRQPGGQISLVTRSGTNTLHGSLFEYFRDDALDAANPFAAGNGLAEAELRQHQFGGALGGPIRLPRYDGRNRSFYFLAYEGLRLRQPRTIATEVLSLSLREQVWPALRPLVAAMPAPTGPEDPETRLAPFAARYSDRSSFDATSLRVDHQLSGSARVFGRVNHSPSSSATRQLSSVTTDQPTLRTTTAGLTHTIGSRITHDLRINETDVLRKRESVQDDFGGAEPIGADAVLPASISRSLSSRLQVSLYGGWQIHLNANVFQRQRQVNVVDTWTIAKGNHQFTLGVDYRQLRTTSKTREYFYFVRFDSAESMISGLPTRLSASIQSVDPVDTRFRNFSAFVDDRWHVTPRMTLGLGLRWELNPALRLADGSTFPTLVGTDRPERMRLAPANAPPYPTDYTAFGPRVGVAFATSTRSGREQTIHSAFGVVTDLGAGMTAQSALYFPHARSKALPAGLPYPFDEEAVALPPRTSLAPPYDGQTFQAFPDHRTPRTYQWHTTIEQAIGLSQTITASYVGARGRHFLRQERWSVPAGTNPDFTGTTFIITSRSNASSDYAALQLQYRRHFSRGLQALASYALSKTEDTVSSDLAADIPSDRLDPEINRGPAAYDRRHVFSGALTYALPAPARTGVLCRALRDWSIAAILQLQSATPVDVTVSRDLGVGQRVNARPDVVPGVPWYVEDSAAPGGRRYNPAAFQIPLEPRMGNLPRNALRGFPFRQLDLSLSRAVGLSSGAKLLVRVDLFNALNILNLANPPGTLAVSSGAGFTPLASFGVARATLDNQFGGQHGESRVYAIGGPRSMQLSARLTF
jgi:Carboxypeptidase regulatory-like domain/TonB dependent receptor